MNIPREWLTAIRDKKGWTHQTAADKSDIERSFYTQIETGARNPSVETAKKIAKAMGFNWTKFFNSERREKQQEAG